MYRHLNELCSDQNQLQNKIQQMKGELERISGLPGAHNGPAGELLDAARENIRKAEQICGDGNYTACAGHIKAAQINIRKARELMGI
jgi:hypothetical protein